MAPALFLSACLVALGVFALAFPNPLPDLDETDEILDDTRDVDDETSQTVDHQERQIRAPPNLKGGNCNGDVCTVCRSDSSGSTSSEREAKRTQRNIEVIKQARSQSQVWAHKALIASDRAINAALKVKKKHAKEADSRANLARIAARNSQESVDARVPIQSCEQVTIATQVNGFAAQSYAIRAEQLALISEMDLADGNKDNAERKRLALAMQKNEYAADALIADLEQLVRQTEQSAKINITLQVVLKEGKRFLVYSKQLAQLTRQDAVKTRYLTLMA